MHQVTTHTDDATESVLVAARLPFAPYGRFEPGDEGPPWGVQSESAGTHGSG